MFFRMHEVAFRLLHREDITYSQIALNYSFWYLIESTKDCGFSQEFRDNASLLLKKGADPSLPTSRFDYAVQPLLHLVSERGQDEVLKFLLDLGLKRDLNRLAREKSPLACAALSNA